MMICGDEQPHNSREFYTKCACVYLFGNCFVLVTPLSCIFILPRFMITNFNNFWWSCTDEDGARHGRVLHLKSVLEYSHILWCHNSRHLFLSENQCNGLKELFENKSEE